MPTDPLADYPPEYLECRVDRHRWGRTARWAVISGAISERIQECDVCGTKRVRVINTRKWTRLGPTRYRYPRGYSRPRSGLIMADYQTAHLKADHAAAENDGRIG